MQLIPAKAILRRDVYYTYACENCEKNDILTPILKTLKEPVVIPSSFASAEVIAHIMTQKFVMASPLYRQEQEWARQGLKLSWQTMSNWVLRATEGHLLPVYEELHWQLVKREVLHADETTLQVLHELGRRLRPRVICGCCIYRLKLASCTENFRQVAGENPPPRRKGPPVIGSASRDGGQSQESVIVVGDGDAVGSQNSLQQLSAIQVKV